jgi:peptidoglycan hydrolase-like protein with peptidoglycan-binding domain
VNTQELQSILNSHGFPAGVVDGLMGPKTQAALIRFQKAYYDLLPTDGTVDAGTIEALENLDATGNLSPNFDWRELRSKGNGSCYVRRELLYTLEVLRDYKGESLRIYSAYRDWEHHKAVYRNLGRPVVKGSKHLIGAAADISRLYGLTLAEARSLRLWSGLGYLSRSKRVTHVDVRHATEKSPFTVDNPSTWQYKE